MTDQQNTEAPTHPGGGLGPMTAAEFRVTREFLGLPAEWLADHLGVALRTVRRWEHGASPVPPGISDELRTLGRVTAEFVDGVIEALLDEPEPAVITYDKDDAYRREHPSTPWPASWHRAAMGRVADEIEELRIMFLPVDGGGDG